MEKHMHTPKGLWQQASNAGAGTLQSDCDQHNRALQGKAIDVVLPSLSAALQTLCLVTRVLGPCSQWHSSCSDTPAEDPSPCPSLHGPAVMWAGWELARVHQAEFLTDGEHCLGQ